MDSDELTGLQQIRDYLSEWLSRNKAAQAIVPKVQELYDTVQWEIDARATRPDEAWEVPYPNVSDSLERANALLLDALPMVPVYDPDRISAAAALTTAGTVGLYPYVARVGEIPVPAAEAYANEHTQEYQQLQRTYGRTDQIRTLLKRLRNPQTGRRFESAVKAFSASRSGAGPRTAAANEIRNLLYGVKGDLLDLARRQSKENMTWVEMAARLAIGGNNSPEHAALLKQETVMSLLIQCLSEVSKDREGNSLTNLQNIWTQVLDFLYIVLRLVRVE